MKQDLVLIQDLSIIFKIIIFVYECKSSSFDITINKISAINKITTWKSTSIFLVVII